MKERREKLIGQREKDDALLNFVNYQAQEAILNPNLPEIYKDEVLGATIGTIKKIAERKAAYWAKHGEGRGLKKQWVIYQSPIEKHGVKSGGDEKRGE